VVIRQHGDRAADDFLRGGCSDLHQSKSPGKTLYRCSCIDS
jgi:hypothetical protein